MILITQNSKHDLIAVDSKIWSYTVPTSWASVEIMSQPRSFLAAKIGKIYYNTSEYTELIEG